MNNPLHKFLALGIITHGEEPHGLDYHTHNGNGFIQKKQDLIIPLANEYHRHIGEINGMTLHYLIEFSIDNLVAEKDPLISVPVS